MALIPSKQTILHQVGRQTVMLYARLMLRLDVFWQAPLPNDPALIVANHPSSSDPIYLLTLFKRPISLMLIESPFRIPIFGALLHQAGYIPVRYADRHTALEEAHQRLKTNQSVVMFPEGDHSPREGGYLPPRTGAARLALQTGVSVVPIGIYLQRAQAIKISSRIAGKHTTGYWYLKGPYGMTIGAPMQFEGDSQDKACVASTSATIMQSLVALAQDSQRRIEGTG